MFRLWIYPANFLRLNDLARTSVFFKIKGATFQPKLSVTPFGLLYYLLKQR